MKNCFKKGKSASHEKARLMTAIVASLFLCAFLLISSCFVALEAGHDCEGEDCPVCACILQFENTLRHMGGVFAFFEAFLFLPVLILFVICSENVLLARDSLVNLRVRLNN